MKKSIRKRKRLSAEQRKREALERWSAGAPSRAAMNRALIETVTQMEEEMMR